MRTDELVTLVLALLDLRSDADQRLALLAEVGIAPTTGPARTSFPSGVATWTAHT
jgi:hypothetical protein